MKEPKNIKEVDQDVVVKNMPKASERSNPGSEEKPLQKKDNSNSSLFPDEKSTCLIWKILTQEGKVQSPDKAKQADDGCSHQEGTKS